MVKTKSVLLIAEQMDYIREHPAKYFYFTDDTLEGIKTTNDPLTEVNEDSPKKSIVEQLQEMYVACREMVLMNSRTKPWFIPKSHKAFWLMDEHIRNYEEDKGVDLYCEDDEVYWIDFWYHYLAEWQVIEIWNEWVGIEAKDYLRLTEDIKYLWCKGCKADNIEQVFGVYDIILYK